MPAGVAALGLLALAPPVRWLARQAQGQLQLLAGRVPLGEALLDPRLTEAEQRALRLVPQIKRFGQEQVGLSSSANYDTVNLDFDQVVWNVSACAADRFEPHVYRYPIVGALPYTGFFDRADAEEELARLQARGLDAYLRSAGAYSSLGWFEDPLWRSMLSWDEERLVNTVLHELAHATVWIKGEGRFNESLAMFVGDRATELWLRARIDDRPDLWQRHVLARADGQRYRRFLHELVQELEELYSTGLPRDEVLRRKAEVLQEARRRYRDLPWGLEGYAAALDPERPLNNAVLMQFRTYHTGGSRFDAALDRFGGDLPAFVAALKGLEGTKGDPYEALDRLGTR